MAQTRASKLISLNDYNTGAAFVVSCNKIIKVVFSLSNDSLVTYITQSDKIVTRRVSTDATSIYSQSLSNDISILHYIQLADGQSLFINDDRVIYVDQALENTASLITYDGDLLEPIAYLNIDSTAKNYASNSYNLFEEETVNNGFRIFNNLNIALITANNATNDLHANNSSILYDEKRVEFIKINVKKSADNVAHDVNGL